MNEIFNIQPNESINDYQYRIYKARLNLELSWQEAADILNLNLNQNLSKDAYRKKFKKLFEEDTEYNFDLDPTYSEIDEKIILMNKQKVKLSDERIQINALVRKIAREETIKEIALDLAKILPKVELKEKIYKYNSEYEGILCISDWHYGLDVNLPWNKYDVNIARERLENLFYNIIKFIKLYQLKHITILNLGDLINGRIHLTLRLNSRIDVITQIIQVTELLTDFINKLSEYVEIDYYDCNDNHSGVEANKTDSLDLESLYRITTWYLSNVYKNSDTVKINLNTLNDDIISFKLYDFSIGAVHGHKDKPEKAIENLTMMTKVPFDLICTAHLHHFQGDEKNECMLISNGSLMGTDDHAASLRYSSKPSQNLIIVSPDNVTFGVHKINV